jgi:hypothetical protein
VQTAQNVNVTVMKKARQIRDTIFNPKSPILLQQLCKSPVNTGWMAVTILA